MPIKNVNIFFSNIKNTFFFLMSQGSLNPKIRFLSKKVCPAARGRTDGQTHRQTDTHESDYWMHPFRVSGVFPSTYHQRSDQKNDFSWYPNTSKKNLLIWIKHISEKIPLYSPLLIKVFKKMKKWQSLKFEIWFLR